jgi:hypothetical protein
MQVAQLVGEVRVCPVLVAHGSRTPVAEGLGRDLQRPRRSARRGTPRRPALGPAGTSFWSGALDKVGHGPLQDLDLHGQAPVVPAELDDRFLLGGRQAIFHPVIDVGLVVHPVLERRHGRCRSRPPPPGGAPVRRRATATASCLNPLGLAWAWLASSRGSLPLIRDVKPGRGSPRCSVERWHDP